MNSELKELVMAGVRWELADFPIGIVQKISNAVVHDTPGRTRIADSVVPPISPVAPVSVDTAIAMASRPVNTESLLRMISEFNHPLRGGATNVVLPSVANCVGKLLIVTDIPSSDDDASGKILIGAAGELLDKMLAAIGLNRDAVSVTPLIFWRTPGGRTPTRAELDLARPFVDKFIELMEPRIILTLGSLAATEIAGVDVIKSHGTSVKVEKDIEVFPIYHPNYLMLKPAYKRDVWTVLQNVQNLLKKCE